MKNNKHYVPNKVTFIIFGLVILGALGYAIYYSQEKKKSPTLVKKNIEVTLINDKNEDPRLIDSDNDGAYDWIEELWPELDPNNPDSDGDGILDGKYIQQRQLIREKERRAELGIQTTLTESEKLGRSIYTALLAIEKAGGTVDEQTEEQISKNVVSYISDLSLGSKIYLRDEINFVPDTKENSYAYRDLMLDIFKRYPVRTSEIDLIMRATENPAEYKDDLESAAIKYNNYIAELAEMKVPGLIAGRHTELLNTLGQLEGGLKNLSLEDRDEVVTLSSLTQLEKTMNTIADVNLNIEKYFDIISDPAIFADDFSS